MSILTKKQKIIEENLDREKNYTIDDACLLYTSDAADDMQ